MSKKWLKTSTVWLMVFALVFLAACSGGNSGADGGNGGDGGGGNAGDEKTLFIGLTIPPTAFNPLVNGETASVVVQSFIFDSLLVMTGPGEFSPKLADAIETTDNQTYTIKLNKNAKWSDGTPITADDVIFTFNLAAHPKSQSVLGAYLAAVEGVEDNGKLPDGVETISSLEKIDDHTVRFKTKNVADPNMLYEQLGSKLYILPQHRLENIPKEAIATDSFTQNPDVTSGPFTFVKYEKDQYVQLKANPNYYLGTPKIDNIYIKILSAANLVTELQTGGIHMNFLGSISKIAVQDYEFVENMDHIRYYYEETLNFQTVMFNHETLPDVRVRQAIAHAVDREHLVNELLRGTGVIVNSPYTPINNYHNPDVPVYEYNPEKAKQLLAEAGWDENRVLNYVVPTGNFIREQAASIIVENLKAVGIKANITMLDFPTTMERARTGQFDLLSMGFTFTYDPDYTSLFGKDQTYNFMRYDSPKSDELLLRGKTEADPAKRKEIYDELQVLWQNELPLLHLYSDTDLIAVSKEVIYGGPKTYGTYADLHLWELK